MLSRAPFITSNGASAEMAGWRMASPAMRLVIIATCPGTFYALITDFIPSSRYLISFFETQGYARPAPAGLGAWYQQEFAGLDGEDPSTGFYGSLSRAYNPSPGRWLTPGVWERCQVPFLCDRMGSWAG